MPRELRRLLAVHFLLIVDINFYMFCIYRYRHGYRVPINRINYIVILSIIRYKFYFGFVFIIVIYRQ